MVEYRNTANRESLEDTKKRGFGFFNSMDLSKYNAPSVSGPTSVAAINQAQQVPTTSPAPMPQTVASSMPRGGFGVNKAPKSMYEQSLEALRGLGQEARGFRETTTPEGTKVRVYNKVGPAIEAEKAIGSLINSMYGIETTRETAAARTALGVERNKIATESNKLTGRSLLQRDILAGQAQSQTGLAAKQREKEFFEKQLIARSPKSDVGKAANTSIGVFRMALEGLPIHEQYQPQAQELLRRFQEFNDATPRAKTAENKQLAIQEFEKFLTTRD